MLMLLIAKAQAHAFKQHALDSGRKSMCSECLLYECTSFKIIWKKHGLWSSPPCYPTPTTSAVEAVQLLAHVLCPTDKSEVQQV